MSDTEFSSFQQREKYDKLIKQHNDEQKAKGQWPPQAGCAQDTHVYKEEELRFRIWLIAQDSRRQHDGLDYNGLTWLDMGTLQALTGSFCQKGIKAPSNVLSCLEKVISGRQHVADTYFRIVGDEQSSTFTGHQHHIDELQRIYDQLENPIVKESFSEKMSKSSWR